MQPELIFILLVAGTPVEFRQCLLKFSEKDFSGKPLVCLLLTIYIKKKSTLVT